MENNEINTLNDVTITEEDLVDKGISSLRDAPNRTGGFGHNGLSAEELRKRFDALPRLVIERLNALVRLVQNGVFAKELQIKLGEETVSLAELWDLVRDSQGSIPSYIETRGYYFKAIDLANKKLYLSHEQVKPVVITSEQHDEYYDAAFVVSYAVGGKLGVVNNFEYSYGTSHVMNGLTWLPSAVIKGIDGNVISYEGDIGFGYIYELSPSSWDSEDYSVYCIDEPYVGEVVLLGGSVNFGYDNKIIGNYGFNAGKGNKVLGSYGVAIGRALEVGYAAFAANLGNKATAHRSFASGSETQALAFASHTEGEGTIAKNVNGQHVEGRHNVPDDEGRYQHIVGGGNKVYRNNKWEITRKNIHTLSTGGTAWYAKEVRVGGTSEDDAKRLATEEYADGRAQEYAVGKAKEAKEYADGKAEELRKRIANLAAAAEGATHSFLEEEAVAYRRRIPKGALPYARLLRLGGPDDGTVAPVRAVASYGASLLPYPYPSIPTEGLPAGITITPQEDGSLIFNGYADRNFSYTLYREYDSLYLPPEPIYADPINKNGLALYVRTGSSGAVYRREGFTPSVNDEYFGHYFVYIYVTAGSRFDNLRVCPSITRGSKKREGVLWEPPVRLEIPEEVRSLPDYGRGGNFLDIEEGCYRRCYDVLGNPIPEERYPLSEEFIASAWIPAQEDGEIVFENYRNAAVSSTLAFGIRLV